MKKGYSAFARGSHNLSNPPLDIGLQASPATKHPGARMAGLGNMQTETAKTALVGRFLHGVRKGLTKGKKQRYNKNAEIKPE